MALCVLAVILAACSGDSGSADPATDMLPDVSADATEVSVSDLSDLSDHLDHLDQTDQTDLVEVPNGPGTWIMLGLPPLGDRQEHSVVALSGEVVMLGGFAGNGVETPTVEALDPVAESWRQLADLPVRMHHLNAVVWADRSAPAGSRERVLVVGYLSGGFVAEGRIFEYDPGLDEWSEREPMPSGTERGSSGVGVVGGRIFVAGGLRGGQALTEVSSYDPVDETWQTHADLPDRRDHMAAAVVDERLYIAGGRNRSLRAHTDSLIVYDAETDEWIELAPMPTSRAGVAATSYAGRLYVFGGEGNPGHASGVFDEAEVYDPLDDSWSELTPLPTRRHGTGAAAVGGMIVVPQGGDEDGFGWVGAVEAWLPTD